jgi:hypothetical protein
MQSSPSSKKGGRRMDWSFGPFTPFLSETWRGRIKLILGMLLSAGVAAVL